MAPDFIILTRPRSGSNMLATLLDDHPGLTCLGEVFHPRKVQERVTDSGESVNKDPAIADLKARRDYAAVLGTLGPTRSSNTPLWGFKHILIHDQAVTAWAVRSSGAKLIVLTRKDSFAEYLSLKRAEATGRWFAVRDVPAAAPPALAFDRSDFLRFLAAKRTERQALKAQLHTWRTPESVFWISYESLVSDHTTRERLFAFLTPALPAPSYGPRTTKTSQPGHTAFLNPSHAAVWRTARAILGDDGLLKLVAAMRPLRAVPGGRRRRAGSRSG